MEKVDEFYYLGKANDYTEVKINILEKQELSTKERTAPREEKNFLAAALLNSVPPPASSKSSILSQDLVDQLPPLSAPKPLSAHLPMKNTPLTSLNLSAEEIHAQRIDKSAEAGVRWAVEHQKDAVKAEFERRKQEGSDVRSRTKNLFQTLSRSSGPANSDQAIEGESPTHQTTTSLQFVPSGLLTGGFIMRPTEKKVDESITSSSLLYTPRSATLMFRYKGNPALWNATMENTRRSKLISSSEPSAVRLRLADETWNSLLKEVRRECANFGVVSSCHAYVLTSEEVAVFEKALLEKSLAEEVRKNALLAERVRIFVRFVVESDAVEAAKRMSAGFQGWKVCFYPTELYDDGKFIPQESEGWCIFDNFQSSP